MASSDVGRAPAREFDNALRTLAPDRAREIAAGVDNVFKRNCAGCHSWAGSWGGARAYARDSLGRMKSGNMPPGGRVPGEQISLVQQWIATGTAR